MKLTKYQHACFTLEQDGKLLVVDPGGFSSDFIVPAGVALVAITHGHPDHFDHEQLAAIVDKNPEVIIIGPEAVTSQIKVFQTRTALPGDIITVGPFTLEFFGGQHALIHPNIPIIANLGVLINDLLYYPGDSFTMPERSVDTLALPVAAPWLKISEVMDFLAAVHPRLAFPTHDAILSVEGKGITDPRLEATAKENGIEYRRLSNPIEL